MLRIILVCALAGCALGGGSSAGDDAATGGDDGAGGSGSGSDTGGDPGSGDGSGSGSGSASGITCTDQTGVTGIAKWIECVPTGMEGKTGHRPHS